MSRAREHLERLASHPRAAGSSAEAAARAHCARVLEGLGFTLREDAFTYSTLPGRWGTPVLGALGVAVVAGAGHLGWRGHAVGALAVLLAGGAVVAGAAHALVRWGTTHCPGPRATSTNLTAVRGRPAVWLVAHLDSKSQPVPIAVRALGVVVSIAVWIAAACVAAIQWRVTGGLAWAWPWLAAAAVVAGAPVVASVVRNRSPGAIDDASGVATVLCAAELAPRDLPLGVLLTSAEELGLAGARAWVRAGIVPPAVAINIDGIDDDGDWRLTFTGPRPGRLVRLLCDVAPRAAVRVRALVPGVLLDAVALADAGWEAVTVSRGTWRTVARVHTPRDALGAVSGSGVEDATRWLVRALGAAPLGDRSGRQGSAAGGDVPAS